MLSFLFLFTQVIGMFEMLLFFCVFFFALLFMSSLDHSRERLFWI